jgi:glycosyltransferase involved in cell wall biosynthesis
MRPQLNIVRIIGRLNVGGPSIQAILMTEAFRARGYGALLVKGQVAAGEADMEYLAAERKVDTVSISALGRGISGWKDLLTLGHLIRILRRQRPAIVHTHTAKAGALGRLAAIVARTPIRVHTFHGHVFKGYFSPLVTRIFLWIERFLARYTDCIVAISESQRRDLTEIYRIAPPQKVIVIPLGVDLAPFLELESQPGELRQAPRPPSAPLVGWIGRFTAIKAPGLFLDCVPLVTRALAVRALPPALPTPRFVMVGGGELKPECERRIAREGLENSVALLGWRRNLAQIYADLDLVVCTSINEGTPVALLEAMASGKAIVSADVGGVRDLMIGAPVAFEGRQIFQNGILVERDPNLIAAAICHLLENPQLRQAMGRAGREFVRERFSQHRLADDLERIYLGLARAKGLLPQEAAAVRRPRPASVFSSASLAASISASTENFENLPK